VYLCERHPPFPHSAKVSFDACRTQHDQVQCCFVIFVMI
jgi:hypothetical protein